MYEDYKGNDNKKSKKGQKENQELKVNMVFINGENEGVKKESIYIYKSQKS